MKLSLINFLALGSLVLFADCLGNPTPQPFNVQKHTECIAVKKSPLNQLAHRAIHTFHPKKITDVRPKLTPVEYIQFSCHDILKKNPVLNQTLKRMSRLPATSKNTPILNDLTLIALNKTLLSHASYKIFVQDAQASKDGYDNFLKGLNSLNNVRHPILRALSIEIAAHETENLQQKATLLKYTFKPGFETDVFSLGCRLEQQEN